MPNTAQLGFVGIFRISMEKFSRMDVILPSLTHVFTEVNIAPDQVKDDNVNPPRAYGRKCYKCGGNYLCPDCPRLQQANSGSHCGHGGDGRGGHGHGIVNGEHGGSRNGDIINSTRDSRDVNLKPMATCKYIHHVDESTIVEIYGATWKFYKIVSALLLARLGYIISPTLHLNIVIVILYHTFRSTNKMTLPLRKATSFHLQLLPAIAKVRNQVMRILMIFNGRVYNSI